MKKMIFSAVALVVFSFAGMANEIEEKKVETKEALGCDHCYDYADSKDDGSDRTGRKWMKNVDACKTSNGCPAEFTNILQ